LSPTVSDECVGGADSRTGTSPCAFDGRLQSEGAQMHPRMRYHEPRLVHDGIAIEQQVEIERARCIGKAAAAAMLRLDCLQRVKQALRGKRGVEQRYGIDEWRLVGVPERLGAIQRGSVYEDGLRGAAEVVDRLVNVLHRPAEVRAACYVGKR